MNTIEIKILKKSVMGLVEGLSATIAQHNADIDFETIWASDSEEAKLDIYYREAITDLENFLASFSSSTTQQFDLQALADDFSITIKTLQYWPDRLSGVLKNQIQNYLVHAIMAGWLSDFPEFTHTDYANMGASDLDTIKEILLKKDFSFDEADRTGDGETKAENGAEASQRGSDGTEKEEVDNTPSDRGTDAVGKDSASLGTTDRTGDGETKAENGAEASPRNEDDARQCFCHEHVDWSGGRPPYELR